jgi:hypothetical protein
MYFKHVVKSRPSCIAVASLNIFRREIPFIWTSVTCVFQCSTQTYTLQLIQVIVAMVLQSSHLFSVNCLPKIEKLSSIDDNIIIKASKYLFALGKSYVLNFFKFYSI